MRVIALWLLLVPASARAQGGDPRPAAPSTGLEVALDASYEEAAALRGAQGGLQVAARVALHEAFELGAGWGARASGAWLDGGPGRSRAGLPPLRAWVGTGGAAGDWRFGLRLEGGASPSLVGAPEASSNGEHGYLMLGGEALVITALYRARVAVGVRAAYSGALAWAGIGRLRVAVELGPAAWSVRPYAVVVAAIATDLGAAGRPGLGVIAELEAGALAVELLGPNGATGELVTLVARFWLGLPDP